jgi:hypothetical protein
MPCVQTELPYWGMIASMVRTLENFVQVLGFALWGALWGVFLIPFVLLLFLSVVFLSFGQEGGLDLAFGIVLYGPIIGALAGFAVGIWTLAPPLRRPAIEKDRSTNCLRCGVVIARIEPACPKCGWTWEGESNEDSSR